VPVFAHAARACNNKLTVKADSAPAAAPAGWVNHLAAAVKHHVKHSPRSVASSRAAAITRRAHDREERQMPLFMDVHSVEGGVSAADVAGAHEADLATQRPYGVNYLRYWVDEEAGKIFCLVDAPDAEAANTVHREAHGLVADEIYPVTEHA
jgi:hypothetical protein